MITAYERVFSISEAVQALETYRPWGRILAGGTDLLPKNRLNNNISVPLVFVDIKRIPELKGIYLDNNWLVIGSNTTLNELIIDKLVQTYAPMLAQAGSKVGSSEIRNRGTVGGNIGSKNAKADLLIPLIAYGAVVELYNLAGKQELLLETLSPEIIRLFGSEKVLAKVKVPLAKSVKWAYNRWTKESMGRPFVSAMVGIEQINEGDFCRLITVLGGTGRWPRKVEMVIKADSILDQEESTAMVKRIVNQTIPIDKDEYWLRIAQVVLSKGISDLGGCKL
ncbi:FAD binding domain-containing protein [Desulfosporosinus metallidurans]|uniref:Xanthine dehydrogenase, FAD binding subunit n=1 Tax=Desulfosporosinus metallidurans TaxID=1888891 RepID=A0A1Q8QZ66_9FIRM|nr:FAD binding domain-containing protein [Desulfosporosinus metallidurans]OLN32637.1 Xanthine dehydrogenase, FAD binding subunit [Desulfosporosinus metallidurans]